MNDEMAKSMFAEELRKAEVPYLRFRKEDTPDFRHDHLPASVDIGEKDGRLIRVWVCPCGFMAPLPDKKTWEKVVKAVSEVRRLLWDDSTEGWKTEKRAECESA